MDSFRIQPSPNPPKSKPINRLGFGFADIPGRYVDRHRPDMAPSRESCLAPSRSPKASHVPKEPTVRVISTVYGPPKSLFRQCRTSVPDRIHKAEDGMMRDESIVGLCLWAHFEGGNGETAAPRTDFDFDFDFRRLGFCGLTIFPPAMKCLWARAAILVP